MSFRSGDLRHVLALQTTEYLTAENQWAPWFAADQTLAYVSRMLSKTASFAKYKVGIYTSFKLLVTYSTSC